MKKQSLFHSLLRKLTIVDPSIIPVLIEYARSIGLDIKVATLTGGPCAGKTDSLIHFHIAFTKRNYQVILLPEAATIVRNQGFRAEEGVYSNDVCQRMMILQNESSLINAIIAAIESHTEGEKRKMIIVKDRSSLDGAAYVENTRVFEAQLADMNISLSHICYSDVTVFLRTLAFDKPDLYRKFSSNNSARFEDVDQAISADKRLLDVYEKYSHPHIITNDFADFEQKLDRVVNVIVDALGEPRLEKETAFMVYDPEDQIMQRFRLENYVDISQFYTPQDMRYRKVSYPGGMHSSYIKTEKIDTDDKATRIETESLVSASEYVAAESRRSLAHMVINKRRHFKTVDLKGAYYILEIDHFKQPFPYGWVRVEVEYGLDCPDLSQLFDGLKYVDITGRKDCSNQGMAEGRLPLNLFT